MSVSLGSLPIPRLSIRHSGIRPGFIRGNDMAVHIWEATGTLRFQIFNPTEHSLDAANIVPFSSWIHVACVTGKGGMKFYVGGHLVGAKEFQTKAPARQ